MVYNITMEKELEEQLEDLKKSNLKEYTILIRKIDEMKNYADVLQNHRRIFNTFSKPLQNYKWIDINDKILIFTTDIENKELHLCEYIPREEVFQ